MFRVLLSTCLLLYLFAIPAQSLAQDKATEWALQAHELLDDSNYVEAAEFISKALQKDPTNELALDAAGRSYYDTQDFERAGGVYLALTELYPESYDYHHLLGSCYERMHNYRAAIASFTEALRLKRNHGPSYTFRSYCYSAIREHNKALDDIGEAIRLDPTSGNAWQSRAYIFAELLEYDSALVSIDSCIKYTDGKHIAIAFKGSVYLAMGRLDEAEAEFLKAQNMDPTYTELYFHRANVAAARYDSTLNKQYLYDAIDILKQQLALPGRKAPEVIINLGYYQEQAGEYEDALASLTEAIELSPYDGPAWNNRGAVRLHLGDLEGALEDVEKGLELFPDNSYGYRNLGKVYLAMGKQEEACAAWQQALNHYFTQMWGPEVENLMKEHCK